MPDKTNNPPQPTSDWAASSVYRVAVEAAPCGMFLCDPQGSFLLVNLAYERLTGYTSEQLCGRATIELVHEPSEFASRRGELLDTLLSTVEPTHMKGIGAIGYGQESEWTYVKRNQSRVNVLVALSRVKDETGMMQGYIGMVIDNTKRAQQQARLWYLSHHDELTGLPNQTWVEEHLDLAIQRRKPGDESVLLSLIELDNLRKLADTLGPSARDTAIKQLADRLRAFCDTNQTLGMIRGSQFAIVSTGIRQITHEREAALLKLISQPIDYMGTGLRLTGSVGSSAFPEAGDEAHSLTRRALLALSAARKDGGNAARHFEFSMQTQSTRRLDLEILLQEAVENQQFSLAFQPQINLKTGKISLAEALLRWQHPIKGAISPAEMIPVAEDTGLILPIGEWVIQTACKQAARILSRFGTCPRIAVNVSPIQFRKQDVLRTVQRALDLSALDPKYLEVEITEGVLLNDTDKSIETLEALRAMGVEIAIDDFGTGYSSLSYLTRFQVDRIKIDRSLVTAMSDGKQGEAIVSAIIAMAHALDIHVTAEGVETKAQADRLAALDCDEVQGYWFSRPLTSQAFETILAPLPSTIT